MMTDIDGQTMVKRLFSRGEAFDAGSFAEQFVEAPIYQFGDYPPCFDQPSIRASAENFFSQITAVYHDIKSMVEVGDTVFVEMDVLYWRPDGSMIALPCADIFRRREHRFTELRIFMDVNPVFDPGITVDEKVSVFTDPGGGRSDTAGVMRRHYAEDVEGQQRVRDGFVPKWSLAGPRWPIG